MVLGLIDLGERVLTIPNSVEKCEGLFSYCEHLCRLPKQLLVALNNENRSLENFCLNCYSLRELESSFYIPDFVKNTASMFKNCHSLEYLSDIFNIPYMASGLYNMFQNCINLKELPESMQMVKSVSNISSMFDNCISLSNVPATFWPEDGFGMFSKVNINYMFNCCSFLTGYMRPDYFWYSYTDWQYINETDIPTGYTLAFKNCFSLTNYIKIPISWGGIFDDENKFHDETQLEMEFLMDNTSISLPIHRTYKTYDRCHGKFIDVMANYDFKINWGDGSKEDIIKCSAFDDIWNTAENSIYYNYPSGFITSANLSGENELPALISGLQHTYEKKGKYTITLSPAADIYGINHTIIDTLYVHENDTYTWKWLRNTIVLR